MSQPRRAIVMGLGVLQLLLLGAWASGLVTLGAIVAPIVFHEVPAPKSADAMTLVFQRFDRVAIACAAVALLVEAVFAVRADAARRADVIRVSCLVVAAGLAITIGVWLSPAIAELHRGGAVRGFGDRGLALEAMHRLAERLAKIEVTLLLAVFVQSSLKLVRVASDAGTSSAQTLSRSSKQGHGF